MIKELLLLLFWGSSADFFLKSLELRRENGGSQLKRNNTVEGPPHHTL